MPMRPPPRQALYDLPRFGNVSLLHMTDCHAQLMPIHFREPSVNLGVGGMAGAAAAPGGRAAAEAGRRAARHARRRMPSPTSTSSSAARRYGKVGGFAHLATLVKRLKASRPGALLLDGGDTWQGSATSLWTNAQDMVDACKLLGVDVMTGHWEFTYGMERVKEIVEKDFKGKVDFVAQNVKTTDFGDPVFTPYVMRDDQRRAGGDHRPGLPLHADRQPALHGAPTGASASRTTTCRRWSTRRAARARRWSCVLSHNGMDVDLKMASRVRGIDAILGGHTHDGVPVPVLVKNAGGTTLVTNAGSNGKFLGVLDFDVKGGKVADFRYTLLPVFANLLPADAEMARADRRRCARPTRPSSPRSSPSPTACCTAAATSTAAGTSSSATR